MSDTRLAFHVAGDEAELVLTDFRLIVAGYTGRDESAVRDHIEELAAIGVPPPESVPAFYPLDAALATTADEIAVAGTNTSGEVEPVIIRAAGRLYLGVGSDHTDRDIERTSVANSKAACPKPIGSRLLPVEDGLDWDRVAVRAEADGRPYQEGTLRSLRIPTDVLALSSDAGERDIVLFGGTVPLIGGEFVAGRDWWMSLKVPGGEDLELTYQVSTGS